LAQGEYGGGGAGATTSDLKQGAAQRAADPSSSKVGEAHDLSAASQQGCSGGDVKRYCVGFLRRLQALAMRPISPASVTK